MAEHDAGHCDRCGRALEYTSFKAGRTTCAPCQGVTVAFLDAPDGITERKQPRLSGPARKAGR